ncbi:MAG: copper-translocating P-type ATPase [Acidimicrobiales bacterium mtb01]|nr:copper-translocating P-type ATPase [Actinomycetota bacterium]TEX46853.1 MAG: copper-translocating P-type ATPase [Acidimicrobiales bacterium mtb01]
MTCAACAARIEKKLNRLDGVTATVNYATSKATVHVEGSTAIEPEIQRLVTTVEDLGYGAVPTSTDRGQSTTEIATQAHLDDIRRRLIVAVIGALPVMVISMIESAQFDGWQWVCLGLATPVVTCSAWPFHKAAWRNARHGVTTMDTLVSLGVIASIAWSVWALVWGGAGEIGMRMSMSILPRSTETHAHGSMGGAHHEIYLEVATTLTAFILAGRFFELRSRRRAGDALRALATIGVRHATLWRDGIESEIPIGALGVGETFVVRPGERVAADGVVVDGSSGVDCSMITGESAPIDVQPGDAVTGGTLNTSGRLIVRATRVGRDTVLAQMARLVERAQDGKAPVQRLADRISSVFVPVVMVLAIGTLVGWLIVTGDSERSFQAAVSVLVIACPCALGLATPVALLVGTGRAAREGVIIKGAHVLEATRAIDVMVLDKTGTLTTGVMTLAHVEALGDAVSGEQFAAIAAVEANSEHPIARAIVAGVRRHLENYDIAIDPTAVSNFANEPGVGVSGVVTIDDEVRRVVVRRASSSRSTGTVVDALIDDEAIARFVVRDEPRAEAKATIDALRKLGVKPMIVSGDAEAAVHHVASKVGIDAADTMAGVLPADKLAVVEQLESQGHSVAMVGDGVNDAAALVAADLGIAMGTGTDAAMEAGDLTIVSGHLSAVPSALRLSRRTLRTIRGNLFWAFAYNVAALPLAVAGLMNPVLAGLAMALSSVFVVSNSLRLRR